MDGSGWQQWLAQQGYLVVGLNNRPSNNYGSAFMKVAYKHLAVGGSRLRRGGQVSRDPAIRRREERGHRRDQLRRVQHPVHHGDVSRPVPVGVANSAVADWRLYDTIYTERYMGLLGDNTAGYVESSPSSRRASSPGICSWCTR